MKHANVAFFVPHAGCPQQCSFCNQKTITGQRGLPSPEEIRETVEAALRSLGPRARDAEIAFFGGSFTAIPRSDMLFLLRSVQEYLALFRGIRISTRPDAVSEEILSLLRAFGVTAIELGAQSMDDRVLSLNRRGHSAEDVRRAAGLIRRRGFSLGLQMMTGLPGDSPAGALHTAEELALLCPDTMRIYPTLVLRGTPLEAKLLAGEYEPETLPEAAALSSRLLLFFEERGIPVIRLGLHAAEELSSSLLAGPFHPAFRELCESRIYLERAKSALEGRPPGEYTLLVAPRCVSKMAGQKKCNFRELSRLGFSCRAAESASLSPYDVEPLKKEEPRCF